MLKKRILLFLLCLILLISGITGYLALDLYLYADRPADPEKTATVIVAVAPGVSFKNLTRQLYQSDLIESPLKFKVLARIKEADRSIIAGEYEMSAAMTPSEILQQLTEGWVRMCRITIPEGFCLAEIADRVEQLGFGKRGVFLEAAANPELTAKMEIAAPSFEGYLFPDTYLFSSDIGPDQMIGAMVGQFKSVFSEKWKKRAGELGLSVHEVVTLASIIEKETGIDAERPLVSSVFHNRLEQGMRLASDPTVIYGIDNFNGNLTRKNLTTMTPYNTYMITGLPPGPIASPGRASLKAALYPADTRYLYFVAKPDKSHYFSTTLAEHNRAVKKYQLSPARR